MSSPIRGRLAAYFEVFLLFAISAFCLPLTFISNPLLLITSPTTFRSKWFERLWNIIGPLQAGKAVQVTQIGQLMSHAKGVVLEIGPGTGEQSHHYRPSQITKIYGAEPNEFLHGKLREKAKAAGLEGKYVPLMSGGEPASLIPALEEQGLIPKGSATLPAKGIFDSIVSIKVLCSVPQSQTAATLAVLQRLLKPGGELIFFEHVENNSDQLTKLVVTLFGWIWPYFTGGCHLTSKVDQIVLSMGGWSKRKVETVEEFQGYEVIRYVKGVCAKA